MILGEGRGKFFVRDSPALPSNSPPNPLYRGLSRDEGLGEGVGAAYEKAPGPLSQNEY